MDEWADDLEKIAPLHPPHVSAYSLMIKKGTPLADHDLVPVIDDVFLEMWELTEQFLQERCRLKRYEISNFARRGFECKHNQDIWRGGCFLGAGPSACYYDGTSRWTNRANLAAWCNSENPEEDYLVPEDRAVEILITGLRTVAGWKRSEFRERTGFDYLELREDKIQDCIKSGLLCDANDRLKLTKRGLLLADYVERELI